MPSSASSGPVTEATASFDGRAAGGFLQDGDVLKVVGARNPLEARLCELAGIRALHVGGHAIGELYHLIPDFGLIEISEVAEWVRRIAEHVPLPIFADGDQCGESLVNVRRSIRALEAAGAAVISIEDARNPKGVSRGTIELASMLQRIEAAVNGRRSEDTVIMARTDAAVFGASADYLVEFGRRAAEVGAGLYFPVHIQRHLSADEAAAVVNAVPLPVALSNATAADASCLGAGINLLSGAAEDVMLQAAHGVFTHIARTGQQPTPADMSDDGQGSTALIQTAVERSVWRLAAEPDQENEKTEDDGALRSLPTS